MYQKSPELKLAGNTFVNVPVLIRHNGDPLIEVVHEITAGYGIKFPIFHSDGTKLAVVKHRQLYRTDGGMKANIVLRHEPNLTVCEVEGRTCMELHRAGAAAIEGSAELYAPEGVLVKAIPDGIFASLNGDVMNIGSLMFSGAKFEGCSVGIDIFDGGIALGLS